MLLKDIDGFEIHPVGTFTCPNGERVEDILADDEDAAAVLASGEASSVVWTVYGHRPGIGITEIVDCHDRASAEAVVNALAAIRKELP